MRLENNWEISPVDSIKLNNLKQMKQLKQQLIIEDV